MVDGSFLLPMDETQDTQTQTESDRYQVLSNGAVYDHAVKKIVKGAALTSVDASAIRQKRTDKRRAAVVSAANENAKAGKYRETFGDLAFFAAMAESAMTKATNPSDPKAIEAANWLAKYTGESEDGDSAGGDSAIGELRGLISEIAELARAVNEGSRRLGSGSVVDVEGVDVG